MDAYQLRVHEEQREVSARLERLDVYIRSSLHFVNLATDDQVRLRHQREIMRQYVDILKERIRHFPS